MTRGYGRQILLNDRFACRSWLGLVSLLQVQSLGMSSFGSSVEPPGPVCGKSKPSSPEQPRKMPDAAVGPGREVVFFARPTQAIRSLQDIICRPRKTACLCGRRGL